jgi:two-component system sensor histidine kinase RegB
LRDTDVPGDSVRQLMVLRTIAVAGQAAAIAASAALGIALPLAPMAAVVGALVLLNVAMWLRLRASPRSTLPAVAGQLAVDLAAFTALLFLAGGAGNPFSLLYVLHGVLMGLLLPPWPAAIGVVLVLACYSLVAGHALPLRIGGGEPPPESLLAFGWWLSVALTVVVVAWFVLRTVTALRRHDRLLFEAARKAQNDETILRLGTLAAGAAHEIATPLTTMAAVVGELRREARSPEVARDAATLAAQIEACRRTIANLHAAADHARAEGGGAERLDAFLDGIAWQTRALRPEIRLTCRWQHESAAPRIFADQSLRQAITVLLNNAADASPGDVEMSASWDERTLAVTVGDRGAGVPPDHAGKLGREFFTTKPRGRGIGLGLVLATSTVRQLGGTLRWEGRAGGGTQAQMVLPLRALLLPESPR